MYRYLLASFYCIKLLRLKRLTLPSLNLAVQLLSIATNSFKDLSQGWQRNSVRRDLYLKVKRVYLGLSNCI